VDGYDRELLDKQTQRIWSSQNDGVMVSMVVAMFFAGIAFGALITHGSEPTRTASNNIPSTILVPDGTPGAAAAHFYR